MFDLVPFAGSRWKVANSQGQAQIVGQILQGHLPQARTVAVAAAAIRCDEDLAGTRETLAAHVLPPALDGARGELRRVAMDPHTHPTLVVGQVIDSVGDGFAQGGILEVVNANLLGLPLPTPFAPQILEIPD